MENYSLRALDYEFICWDVPKGGAIFRQKVGQIYEKWECVMDAPADAAEIGLRHYRGFWWKHGHALTPEQVKALPQKEPT